jgi:hypothetical protein
MENPEKAPLRRSVRIMLISLLIYGVLVATHLGEFWPFSIFPMFSQAGHPWVRSMAMDVTEYPEAELWSVSAVPDLPGDHFSMREHNVDQIDYSNFVSKTTHWTPFRIQALRNMLGEHHLEDRRIMIYKVRGELAGGNTVAIEATPMLLLEPDTTLKNPNLPQSFYFRD